MLKQWRDWTPAPRREPSVVQALPLGLSNTSLLVSDGLDQWVLRLDQFDPRHLGLNRSIEYKALQLAAKAACAPEPIYHNPDLGVLVCRYLTPDASQAASPKQVAELLRRIHALPSLHNRLDLRRRAQRYVNLSGGNALPEALLRSCMQLERLPPLQRLCHNDLLAANRLLSAGKLYALDWEYAATGDPWFDVAVIIEGDAWSERDAEDLLQTWLSRRPSDEELERLHLQRYAYRALAQLWREAMDARPWRAS